MSLGPDVGKGNRAGPGLDRDSHAYAEAHRMLDQYGIAYIYRHPEVLLGIAPGSSLADRMWRQYRHTYERMVGVSSEGELRHRQGTASERLEWLLMMYRAPENMFSPHGQDHGAGHSSGTGPYDRHDQAREGFEYPHVPYR